jgi:ankyrin repeat protein
MPATPDLLGLPYELHLEMAQYLGSGELFTLVRISRHSYGIFRSLLDRRLIEGSDIRRRKRMTPLQWAARTGQSGLVRLLLERGVDIDELGDTQALRIDRNQRPVCLAAINGDRTTLQLLLDAGARIADPPPNVPADLLGLPIHLHAEIASYLTNRPLFNLIRTSADVYAMYKNHLDRRLFDGRAIRRGRKQMTPLQWVSHTGQTYHVRRLIEDGADVDEVVLNARQQRQPYPTYNTALALASIAGHRDVVSLLLDARATIRGEIVRGRDTYHAADALLAGNKYAIVGMIADELLARADTSLRRGKRRKR